MDKYDDTFLLVSIGHDILSLVRNGKNNNSSIAEALGLAPPHVSKFLARLQDLDLIVADDADAFKKREIRLTERGETLGLYLDELDFPKLHLEIEAILGRYNPPKKDLEERVAAIVNELSSEQSAYQPKDLLENLSRSITLLKQLNVKWYKLTSIHNYLIKIPDSDLTDYTLAYALHLLRDAVIDSKNDPRWRNKYDLLTESLVEIIHSSKDDEVILAAFEILGEFRSEGGTIPIKVFSLLLEKIWLYVTPGEEKYGNSLSFIMENLRKWKANLDEEQLEKIKKVVICLEASTLEAFFSCTHGEKIMAKRKVDKNKLGKLKREIDKFIEV